MNPVRHRLGPLRVPTQAPSRAQNESKLRPLRGHRNHHPHIRMDLPQPQFAVTPRPPGASWWPTS
jgi:hypothetical protein